MPEGAQTTISLTEADHGKEIKVKNGTYIQITLPVNPTTGYVWEIKESPDSARVVVRKGEPKYVSDDPFSQKTGAGQGFRFHFSDEQLDTMERMLIEREVLLAELLPWEHPNFGTDEGWIRAYPYELETCAGGTCQVEVCATLHASQAPSLAVEAVLPPGWTAQNTRNAKHAAVSVGEVNGERLVRACLSIDVPQGTKAGRYPVAFRVTWDGRYLGQVCHAMVNVW